MAEVDSVARGWRIFFWAAAIYNFLIGLSGMITPQATVDARIVGLLLFAMGIVYFLVARDPLRYAQALWAGVISKVGVVALLAPEAFGPSGNPLIAGILIGDALFALGFLAFLFKNSNEAVNS